MNNKKSVFALKNLDLKHNWHPCSQMKDYKNFPPLLVKKAYGSHIELSCGKKIIDGISSWWCKSLGHNHPELKKALLKQVEFFEHVIFADTTHETIAKLGEKITSIMPGLNKVFYAGDGSSAVEIAMKMSLHFRYLQGKSKKNAFIALTHGYHGETLGALSVSDLGIYRKPYQNVLFSPNLIAPPYINNISESLWLDSETFWLKTQKQLEKLQDCITAIIFEPIVQGAGGMKIYSQDFLQRLASWAQKHDIHLIADEIMTGIGRTGKMLACQHAKITPDFLCLSKGLTSGWMPFSTVLTSDSIYQAFYDDYESGKTFLHSHTYSGYALGASVALATLKVLEKEKLVEKANQLQVIMQTHFREIQEKTGLLTNLRGIGAIMAADWVIPKNQSRFAYHFYQEAIRLGALLRPLGSTLYWLPPLNITEETLEDLKKITIQAAENCRLK